MADQSEYNGALLAYLGDAVTELWVRETLLSLGVRSPAACNAEALGLVTAKAQSESFSRVEGMLTRNESDAERIRRVPAYARCGRARRRRNITARRDLKR